MKLKVGDKVKVMSGKDRGRESEIEKVFLRQGQVLLAGINLYKKHVKPRPGGGRLKQGGIIDVAKPLPASAVALICPKCGQPTRVGYQVSQKGESLRICRKCSQVID